MLDDYHLAEGPHLRPGMAFLLDRLPPQVHVVISTRADPRAAPRPAARRRELVEIRAADLRFTSEEVTTYLNDVNTGCSASASASATSPPPPARP